MFEWGTVRGMEEHKPMGDSGSLEEAMDSCLTDAVGNDDYIVSWSPYPVKNGEWRTKSLMKYVYYVRKVA